MEISNTIYKYFADYIYSESGMVYEEKDYYRLETRIKELVKIFELNSADEVYQKYAKGPITPDMNAVLINISTNNETYFFRDVKPFTALTKEALPQLLEENPMGSINIWCAACSYGQEAYSILMSIKNHFNENTFNRVVLDATDISTEALEKAKLGIYNGLDVQRGLPINLLMKYFTQLEDEEWQIDKHLANKVQYKYLNLLQDDYPVLKYHIIFCRNMLIYQNKENKNAIINKLFHSLKPGGFLFLGNGESLIGMDTEFDRYEVGGLTIYHKKDNINGELVPSGEMDVSSQE
jgi:chemotaxis protein methyltransferase CheR